MGWLRGHDPGLVALRRAGRTAVVMPALFALGDKVVGNAAVATFAAFGSFALLLFVDFTGPMRDRLQAQAALAAVGLVFVCVGTLASRTAWSAAVAMAGVAFCVLFAGVVSSVLAAATSALLLAFILPVSLPGPASEIPDRLAGWALASVASLAAIALLWPAPSRDPLRARAAAACRALADRLRSEVAVLLGGDEAPSAAEHQQVVAAADAAVGALHQGFLATPYRPTGLSTSARTVVRLVDELNWLNAVIQSGPRPPGHTVNRAACAVKVASATVLDSGATLLEDVAGSTSTLVAAVAGLRGALARLEQAAEVVPPSSAVAMEVVTALDPAFRAQELSFAVTRIAGNIELTAAAERRSWADRLMGRQPAGVSSTVSAAQERAAAHLDPSVGVDAQQPARSRRAGPGRLRCQRDRCAALVLGGARRPLGASVERAEHRSERAARAARHRGGIRHRRRSARSARHRTTLLWFLLPPAVLLAGVLPAAISFAAGQAAFTVALVILFNIIAPAGWQIGLLRVEDVAIGCAVSLLVGLLFWPRGARAALGRALADAYSDSARYLADAVGFGMLRCDARPPSSAAPSAPTEASVRAAAASRRLDDAFRTYLAERGPKPIPLADVTNLVTGVGGLRLAGMRCWTCGARRRRVAAGTGPRPVAS